MCFPVGRERKAQVQRGQGSAQEALNKAGVPYPIQPIPNPLLRRCCCHLTTGGPRPGWGWSWGRGLISSTNKGTHMCT
jgi:hypothetical protein